MKNPFFTTLVIDDQLSFAGFLQEFLRVKGPYFLMAHSAQEALAKARESKPDLILLSSELEGASGLGLMNELLMELPSAAVVMMASRPSVSEAVEAMKRGAADYLERPLVPEKLKQAIDFQKALFDGEADPRGVAGAGKAGAGLVSRRKDDEVGGEGG